MNRRELFKTLAALPFLGLIPKPKPREGWYGYATIGLTTETLADIRSWSVDTVDEQTKIDILCHPQPSKDWYKFSRIK